MTDEQRPAVESLERLDLLGEPDSDKAFVTPSGTRFRARIVRTAELAAHAPVNGDADISPSQITLSLSLALLDADGAVAKDQDGRLIITDAHEIVIAPALMVADFSLEAAIDQELRQAAFALEKKIAHRDQIDRILAGDWG